MTKKDRNAKLMIPEIPLIAFFLYPADFSISGLFADEGLSVDDGLAGADEGLVTNEEFPIDARSKSNSGMEKMDLTIRKKYEVITNLEDFGLDQSCRRTNRWYLSRIQTTYHLQSHRLYWCIHKWSTNNPHHSYTC